MAPEDSLRLVHWLAEQPEWVREAYHTDGMVNSIVKHGFNHGASSGEIWRNVAHSLRAQLTRANERICAMDLIVPRKVRGPDGQVYIYRCPDELVPETPA